MNPRTALVLKLSIITASFAGAVALFTSINAPQRVQAAASLQVAPTPQELQVAMYRCGLDPRSLAAAGIELEDVEMVVDDCRTQLTSSAATLASADASIAQATQTIDALERTIQSGQGAQQDVTDLAAARATLASATSTRHATLDTIFNAATEQLDQTPKNLLSSMRGNRAWDLPLQYLIVNRTQEQWIELRDALSNERFALANQESPATAAATLLSQVRTQAVNDAATNLTNNLNNITNAWNSLTASTIE